uniref:Uncharacterized protein n=1 Tax=Lepeophtheirus salmonis TaxID=72036 RepID=A0A0K2TFD7_LEPSM
MLPYENIPASSFNQEQKRCALMCILCNLNGEVDNAFLARAVGCSIRFVQKVRKRVEQDGNDPLTMVSRKLRDPEAAKTVRSPALLEKINKKIEENPDQSMNAIAESIDGASRSTVHRAINTRRKEQLLRK